MNSGVLLALGAYLFWGLTPLFWKLLSDVPAVEQLAHRIVWSLPLLVVAATITRGIRRLGGVDRRGWARFLAGGLLLSVNWGVFVWAVASDRVVEASLGYYINPLVSVALGVAVLGERLRPKQWTAVGLAAAGVLYLALRLGEVPWVSLALAFSFGLYGLLQKRHGAVGPWASLGAEIMWLWPVALGAIVVWGVDGAGSFGSGAATTTWLLLTGPVTITPLLLFGAAARRIPLATIGLLQYLAPTMQLLLGVFAFGEPMPIERLVGFVFVWVGVALYLWDLRTSPSADAMAPT
ncbi:MAG: EamA family transporter RarD [Acidimicrobiia bacterium]